MFLLLGLVPAIPAQTNNPLSVFRGERISFPNLPLLAVGDRVRLADERRPFDFKLFAHELVAFVLKEVLYEAPNLYFESDVGSPFALDSHPSTGSRLQADWSRHAPTRSSDFGDRCLTLLARFGSELTPFRDETSIRLFDDGSSSALARDVVAKGTAFAVRSVWTPLRREIENDNRHGLSMRPDVSPRKLSLSFTYRW